ncbi:MAG: hypothetical protein ACRDNW_21420, partial [Trebonia sp.]
MTADSTARRLPAEFARRAAPQAAGRGEVSPLVVGVDFGTLSARAVVVRASDGAELGTGVGEYAHGAIERALPSPSAG